MSGLLPPLLLHQIVGRQGEKPKDAHALPMRERFDGPSLAYLLQPHCTEDLD